MQSRFDKQVAIVTGASSGIGWWMAVELAKAGASVTLAARREEALQRLAGEIEGMGGQALAVRTDVTRREEVDCLVQRTLERWGRVDIVVANSGQYLRRPVRKLDTGILEQAMAVNFYGNVHTVLAALPAMVARGRGHIVLMSSMDAKIGLPPDAPYVASKAALSGFGAVLRQELHGTGVHVTIVFPGRVDTPMIENLKFHRVSPKIDPRAVARATLQAMRRGKAEVFIPAQARLLHLLYAVSPGLADWMGRLFHLQGWEV